MTGVIDQLLRARGIHEKAKREEFLSPSYDKFKHDPYLLPDMLKAVDRLILAKKQNELVYIYGDYDIDGLTATSLLLDAFSSFNLKCEAFIPNRFVDGYGLSAKAIEELAQKSANLIVTVDCGSLSHKEIDLANKLGVDVIVTDHHSVADTMPNAIATINPKRTDHKYPFIDLAGVGVAFKLVQAMQQKMQGLPNGQEKWLLDLVAMGTVCDVVQLVNENRANVLWGLKVLQKTRRPGLRSMAQVAGLEMPKLNARSLGYVIGPHLNAAGRLETAQHSLDLITAKESLEALDIAYKLRDMNLNRRAEQDRIFAEAKLQAENFADNPVLVLSSKNWSHGIIGIVAAKILEYYKKPTFVLEEMGEEAKGSARSYGDFSAVEAIRASDKWLIKGGGHKLAAGVTLKTDDIDNFRQSVNEFYKQKGLQNQLKHLDPVIDVTTDDISQLDFDLMSVIKSLEPFGNGNSEPIFRLSNVSIQNRRHLGKDQSHLKLSVCDKNGNSWDLIGFGLANKYDNDVGETIDVIFKIIENEWRGTIRLEGQLIKIEVTS